MPVRFRLLPVLCLAVLAAACTGEGETGKVKVVASIYPLAWLAEEIGGARVEVTDLTPPGVEAHDLQLTAVQRTEAEDADLLLVLPVPGFQSSVDHVAEQRDAGVVRLAEPSFIQEPDEDADPHIWLDPILMRTGAGQVTEALSQADPDGRADYERNGAKVRRDLEALSDELRSGFEDCEFGAFITTHEAFGYLAEAAGIEQIGIEGVTPESEPSAERIEAAIAAIDSGEAAPVVFYEGTDEGKRVAESVASDAGARTLPLDTLESTPESGDYLSGMRESISVLQEGLRCR